MGTMYFTIDSYFGKAALISSLLFMLGVKFMIGLGWWLRNVRKVSGI
jgi:hypothetical protein